MRAFDRLGPASALTADIIGRFDGDMLAMMRWARVAEARRFRRLRAARVRAARAEGDRIALDDRARRGARHRRADARRSRAWRRTSRAGRGRRRSLASLFRARDRRAALSRRCTIRPTARSCSSAASSARNGKPRNEGSLRRAHLRRRTAARRLRARCRGRLDPGAYLAFADRPRGGEQLDLGGGILAPGFIDWQINGGGGVLFNANPTVEGIARSPPRIGALASPLSCRRS